MLKLSKTFGLHFWKEDLTSMQLVLPEINSALTPLYINSSSFN